MSHNQSCLYQVSFKTLESHVWNTMYSYFVCHPQEGSFVTPAQKSAVTNKYYVIKCYVPTHGKSQSTAYHVHISHKICQQSDCAFFCCGFVRNWFWIYVVQLLPRYMRQVAGGTESITRLQFEWIHPEGNGYILSTLRPRQNGRHFADDILKCIFLNENVWIPMEISLKFVPKGPIDNIPALV